jgi:hypothetical protein
LDEALPWQRGHGRRTAQLAQRLGLAAGFCTEAIHHLTLAALLHDIGLLALPSSLTSPTGYLDLHAYAARQSHPRLGAQWLEPYRFLRKASVIIAHHHERWDGSGYPIDVLGVDDPKMRDEASYRIIRSASGTQFDAHLVELCPLACSHQIGPSEHPHQSVA